MTAKTIRQQLVERLYEDFGLRVDPMDLVSFRRNGYGVEMISWATLRRTVRIQSKLTMRQAVRVPILKRSREGDTINIDLCLREQP